MAIGRISKFSPNGTKQFLLSVLVAAGLALLAPTCESAGHVTTQDSVRLDPQVTRWSPVIDKYVRETRGWDRKDYRIKFQESRHSLLVFFVLHKDDDALRGQPKGETSFIVEINPETGLVVKELGFQ
jgi:hypothetical protein